MTTQKIKIGDLERYREYLMPDDSKVWELYTRLLKGEASKEEVQDFIDWRNQSLNAGGVKSGKWELEKYNRANNVNL